MKLNAKILLVLFGISCTWGYHSFTTTHAVKTDLKTADITKQSPFIISTAGLQADCNMANSMFEASGENPAVYLELKKCCSLYDIFQICNPERIATISEIKEALRTAVCYFVRTEDKRFIQHIISYIQENNIDLSGNIGLPLLKFAIIIGDDCHEFVNFLIKRCHVSINEKNQSPLHLAAMCRKYTMIEILLNCGADFRATYENGNTPYQIAMRGAANDPNHRKTVEIFKKYFRSRGIVDV